VTAVAVFAVFIGSVDATALPVQMLATSNPNRITTVSVTAPDTAEVSIGVDVGSVAPRPRTSERKNTASVMTNTIVVVQNISHHSRSMASDCGPAGLRIE